MDTSTPDETIERGTKLHESKPVQFPDGTTRTGSIWQVDTGLLYAEVNSQWYALVPSLEQYIVVNSPVGPVFQGLSQRGWVPEEPPIQLQGRGKRPTR